MPRTVLPRILAVLALVAGGLLIPPAASAAEPATGVDDFDFSSWDARFEVGVDDDGRATLHVTETRVAEFPEFDQNRGIVAGFADSYEDAPLHTEILSVRDENGADVPYEIEKSDGLVYVLTGTDDYVHGSTTYVIEYEMHDVVLAAEGTGVDEFYWDLLPQNSTQDIDEFHAEIVFDDALAPHLTGNASCYFGYFGKDDSCQLEADDGTFVVETTGIRARQGVTVAIALEPGTVVQPSIRLPNAATDIAPYFLGGGAVLAAIGSWFGIFATARRHRRATGIVVAQYEVPVWLPPLLAKELLPWGRNPLSAQILHFAVNGVLRIEDAGDKTTRPSLRRLDGAVGDPYEERAVRTLFGTGGPGAVKELPKNSQLFAQQVKQLLDSAPAEARQRGWTTTVRSTPATILQWIAIACLVVMAGLFVWAAIAGRHSWIPVLIALIGCAIFVGISAIVSFSKHTVLTPEGALHLEHLDGVREFIRVAEADRLRMLQSYTGAERRSDGTVDVIHVYEKLLPYAVLFGQEREWGAVLEYAYGQGQREATWMDGSHVDLSSRLTLFSAATSSASTYTDPSSGGGSSSFGGSSGGGFSGGGGGGGFSGGR